MKRLIPIAAPAMWSTIALVGLAASLRPPASIWRINRTPHPQTVTLAWTNPPDPALLWNNLYWGDSSRHYTNLLLNIPLTQYGTNQVTLTNLGQGVFYFAATTEDAGMESDYSNEAIWTNLPPPPVTNFLLSVSIQQSRDFTNWTTFTNLGQFQATNSGAPMYWRALMNIQPQ